MAKEKRRSSMYVALAFDAEQPLMSGCAPKPMECYTVDDAGNPFTSVTAAREYFAKHVLPTWDSGSVGVMIASITEAHVATRQVKVSVDYTPVDIGALIHEDPVTVATAATMQTPAQEPPASDPTDDTQESDQVDESVEPEPEAEAESVTPPWEPLGTPVSAAPSPTSAPESPKHEVPVEAAVNLSAIINAVKGSMDAVFVFEAAGSKIIMANGTNPQAEIPGVLLSALRQIVTSGNVIDLKAATAATTDPAVTAMMGRAKMRTVMQRVIVAETLGDAQLVIACEAALIEATKDTSQQAVTLPQ